jgi:uncharacterized protein YcbK (DUF882 family)
MRPASKPETSRTASRSHARAPWVAVTALAVAMVSGDLPAHAARRKPASRPGQSKVNIRRGKKAQGSPALALAAPLRRSVGASVEPSRDDRHADGARSRSRRGRKSARPEPDRWPPMQLEAVNTKERLNIRLYDRRGHTLRTSTRRLWHLMRCHITGQEHPIHARLLRSLYKISRHYPGRTVYIYSGYRARRVASLRSSNHVKGRAMDFRVAGVTNRALRDYLLKTYRPAGIGYYPNAPFVHFDVRDKQSAFWVDHSGKGEAAEYSSNPYAELKREKSTATKNKPPASGSLAAPAPGADEPAEKGSGRQTRGREAREGDADETSAEPPAQAPRTRKGGERDADERAPDTSSKPEKSSSPDEGESAAGHAAPP